MTTDCEDTAEVKGSTVAEDTADSSKSVDDVDSDDVTETEGRGAEAATAQPRARRQIALSLRSLVVGVVIAVLVVAVAVMTWLYLGERSTVQAQVQKTENYQRAEQVALDYAVGAATMNFEDLNTWKGELVEGTSPELRDKLTKAADSMQQLLIPLEWNSTSEPLVAKVRSEENGVYVVDTFVSVLTKTTQAPDSLQSTATYSVTIDGNNGWQITDVGGIGAVVGAK